MALPTTYDLGIYRGDTFRMQLTAWQDDAETIPLDLAGATATAEIRSKAGGKLLATIDVTLTAPNIVDLELLPAVTATLAPGKRAWDLEVSLANGDTRTVLAGAVTVVADVTNSVPAVPVPGPDLTELAFADFVNGVYREGGVATTLLGMFYEDTKWGPWDETAVIANGNAPVYALQRVNATIVVRYTTGADGTVGVEVADFNSWSPDIGLQGNAVQTVLTNWIGESSPSIVDETPNAIAAAFTIVFGKLSLSVMGNPVSTLATTWNDPLVSVGLIANSGAVIQQITIYTAQPDTALPGLSS